MSRGNKCSLKAFSPEIDSKIRDLHAEGCGFQKIAKIIGRNRRSTLSRMIFLGLISPQINGGGRKKKGFWTEDIIATVRQCNRDGLSARETADLIGCSQPAVSKKLKSLGLNPPSSGMRSDEVKVSKIIKDPPHVQAYKAARRGAVIPPDREVEYYELLKKGVSIAEAKARIGITPTQEGKK